MLQTKTHVVATYGFEMSPLSDATITSLVTIFGGGRKIMDHSIKMLSAKIRSPHKQWKKLGKNRRHHCARSTIEKTSDRQDKKISSRRIIIRGEPLIRNRGKNTIPFDFLFYLPLNDLNHDTRVNEKIYVVPRPINRGKNSR